MRTFPFKVSFLTFVLASIFIVSYTFLDHYLFQKQLNYIGIENGMKKIDERESFLSSYLSFTKATLLALEENPHFQNYLLEKNKEKKNLENLFKTIIKLDKNIMQIRFINKDGMEEIRFDRERNHPEQILSISKLQDKSSRYYFQEVQNTQEKIWFSALDLNIENGVLDTPLNPTFRVALPLYHGGKFQGMVIVNYFAEIILQQLFNAPVYDMTLIDQDGYILQHHKKEKSWSRFKQTPFKIEQKYLPVLQHKVFKGEDFAGKALNLPLQNKLYLILQLSEETKLKEHEIYFKRIQMSLSLFIFLLLMATILLYFILYKWEKLNHINRQQANLIKQKTKMATVGEMIANIAHQWRQPLAVLSMNIINLEVKIKNNKATPEFLQSYIKKSNETIKNMDQTIKDFSEFFKPNKIKTTFSLQKSIEEILYFVHDELLKYHITTSVEIEKDFNYLGYKNELIHVLLNIITNAKDAIASHHQTDGSIHIALKEENQSILIVIQDNAGGIPDDILGDVFEPYFTTKFDKQGTGIGLYMGKMIVEESFKGDLKLENYNNGLRCTIRLPKELQ